MPSSSKKRTSFFTFILDTVHRTLHLLKEKRKKRGMEVNSEAFLKRQVKYFTDSEVRKYSDRKKVGGSSWQWYAWEHKKAK